MSGTPRVGSYRALLTRPGVPSTMVLANFGRLGYAMLPLLLLFTITDSARSFSTAATAMAIFGLTSFTMPIKGQLVDRYGQQHALPVMAGLTGAFLTLLGATALLGRWMPDVMWMALAALAGIAAPPLGPSTRAQWRLIAPDDVGVAYAFDATIEEACWLVGPALAGALIAVLGPAIALLVVPFLLLVGALGLGRSRWRPLKMASVRTAPVNERYALRNRQLWPVLFTMFGTGLSGALMLTGVAAVANNRHERGLAAIAEVVLGVGGVIGGILWGKLNRHPPRHRGASVLLRLLAMADLVIAIFHMVVPTIPALVISGAMSASLGVLAYQAADDAVPQEQQTEASTWVTTMANLGTSGGMALAGWLASQFGATYVLFAPVFCSGITALVTGVTWGD